MKNFIKIFWITLLTVCYQLEAKNVPGVSYIDNVVLNYNNVTDIWICDRIICPSGTFGCKILKRNNPNRPIELICTDVCYDSDRNTVVTSSYPQAILSPKTINILVNSYVDAESVWTAGYSLSMQSVNATIAAGDWPEVQKTVRDNMRDVDESNAY
ncbi:uncharacterized protein LOC101452394 [Ceratitis capitata]|uniref:(Mediterranean fruit fly) hypothetical protein n=2 Tax=Ceratitis capitata TaxID=7213 RepID=A0A811V291_CERCA|nr:uncharacterized protein LOC101452394 [Ceratitis capitata]CAD7005170.1 unnamed protein product [Ceratitis capitata]